MQNRAVHSLIEMQIHRPIHKYINSGKFGVIPWHQRIIPWHHGVVPWHHGMIPWHHGMIP